MISSIKLRTVATVIIILVCMLGELHACPPPQPPGNRRNLSTDDFNSCDYMEESSCSTIKFLPTETPRNLDIDNINTWANNIVDWACCKILTATPENVGIFIFEWQQMCYKNSRVLKNGLFDDRLKNTNYEEIINFCPDSLVSTKHNYGSLETVIERSFSHDSKIICETIPEQNKEDEYGSFTVLYSENHSGMGIGHMVGIFNENTDIHNDNFVNWHFDMSADKAGCRGEHNFENDVMDQYTFFRGGLGTVYSLDDYQNQGSSFKVDAGYTFENINVSKMKKKWINFQQENGYDLIQANCAHAVWDVLFKGLEHCHLANDIARDFMWPRKTINLVEKLATASNQGRSLSYFELKLVNQLF